MLLSKKEIEIRGIEQCSPSELERIQKFYEKLNIPDLMTLKGFYIIFWKELKVLNLNKIHNFGQLCIKMERYKKHLRRTENRGKLHANRRT